MRSPWISSIFRPGRETVPLHRARGGLARLLLIVLLPLVLGPLLTVALLLYRQAQADITHQVLAQLTALSSLKEKQIDDWAFNRQADMNNLVKTPDVLAAAQAFVLVEDPLQGEAQGQAGMRAAGQALQSRFDAYLRDTNNAEYFALLLARADTGEVVLASTSGQKMLGQKFLNEVYFRTARGAALVAPARLSASRLWAASMRYPLGILDTLAAIAYVDSTRRDTYRFVSWQRSYDRWQFYVMGFWNPEQAAVHRSQSGQAIGQNPLTGQGFQVMAVFNH